MASEEGGDSGSQEAAVFDAGVERATDGFSNTAPDDEDDFGDFGDFNELDNFSNASETHTPVDTAAPTQSHPSIESALARAGALFSQSADAGIQAEALEDCLTHVFGARSTGIEGPAQALPQVDLLSSCQIESYIAKIAAGPALEETEPRLLRNMLVVAMSADLSDEYRELLLTPLSQLQSKTNGSGKGSAATSLLALDEIRQIATQGVDLMENDACQIERLQHALDSITQLTEIKEQEIAKQKDAISAYNQVIQTLVAQASKLH
ncbi:hypothetical protein H4R20_001918 [Coemansia guatemalensis]|uniref:Uncharacterized protein n=1 Tax=Coemansia guatemalensis TaxID=2761395 RepID=A0A9W8HWJ0_9FUNG|nr:hypothetical protein H4R20_001918 [Coemansia guatemalensis]